jgi:hypothetical protein
MTNRSKNLSEAFDKENKPNNIEPESIPQVQSSTFREDKKTVIRIKQPSFGEKVKNFAKAVGSRVTKGRATEDIVKLRVLACHGNGEISPCPYRGDSKVRDGFHFCTACGCGDKPHTWLNNPEDPEAYTKLDYPWVSCPIRNPGFGDYKDHEFETPEDIVGKEEGMARKKVIEVYLKSTGVEIPDHPAPQPKNGE